MFQFNHIWLWHIFCNNVLPISNVKMLVFAEIVPLFYKGDNEIHQNTKTALSTDVNWKAGVSHLFKAGLLKCALNETCSAVKQGYTSMKRHREACQSQSRLRCCYRWAIRTLLINSAANHHGPCFRPANLDFITGTYGTSTVHYCSAPVPWPSGNLIPARRQVNWDCMKIAALSLVDAHNETHRCALRFRWEEACA